MNGNKLKEIIEDIGIPISVLSRKIGCSREALYKKMYGKTEFKASEMTAISSALRLTDKEMQDIFLSRKVN